MDGPNMFRATAEVAADLLEQRAPGVTEHGEGLAVVIRNLPHGPQSHQAAARLQECLMWISAAAMNSQYRDGAQL